MPTLKERFVTNARGRKTGVILSLSDYHRLLDALEELDCIRAYDAAKASGEVAVPLAEALAEIERTAR